MINQKTKHTDKAYRYKIIWYNNMHKVVNRVFCCNMGDVCKILEIERGSLFAQLKNTAHTSKWRNIKVERVYIPRKIISYFNYTFDPANEIDSDSDSDDENVMAQTHNNYSEDEELSVIDCFSDTDYYSDTESDNSNKNE